MTIRVHKEQRMKRKTSLIAYAAVFILGFAILAPSWSAGPVSWPASAVTIYVPASAGGGTDLLARVLANTLNKTTGRPFIVVNQSQGGGIVAFESTRTASPTEIRSCCGTRVFLSIITPECIIIIHSKLIHR
jgi:Uncharacterized protein conserved in bacteria